MCHWWGTCIYSVARCLAANGVNVVCSISSLIRFFRWIPGAFSCKFLILILLPVCRWRHGECTDAFGLSGTLVSEHKQVGDSGIIACSIVKPLPGSLFWPALRNWSVLIYLNVLFHTFIVLGGISTGSKTVASVYHYDPSRNYWQEDKPLPEPERGASAVSIQNKIYAFGDAGRFYCFDTYVLVLN